MRPGAREVRLGVVYVMLSSKVLQTCYPFSSLTCRSTGILLLAVSLFTFGLRLLTFRQTLNPLVFSYFPFLLTFSYLPSDS